MADNVIALEGGVTISHETLTPELATKLLDANINNRNEIISNTEKLVRALQEGRLLFVGDPIRVSDTGRLIDGAHRCRAVKKTGISMPVVIIRGLPDSSQKVIDQGSNRKAGQQLTMDGVKNGTRLASVAALLIRQDKGLLFTNSRLALANDEKTSFVEDHASAFLFVQNAVRAALHKRLPLTPSTVGAAAFRVYEIIPPEGTNVIQEYDSIDGRGELDVFRANWFFHVLGTGEQLKTGSPIMALRDFAIRKRRLDRKVSQDLEFYYIVRTWNAWRTNTELSKLQRPSDPTPDHWKMV